MSAAVDYAYRGWAVLPLHSPTAIGQCSCRAPDCASIGKHPRLRNGVKDASKDFARVTQWWRNWPAANVGIATGEISNLLVVDIDGAAGLWSWEDLCGRFGEVLTLTANTGRGKHLYFRHVPGARNRVRLADGIDIRSTGGYVVAPPSVHCTGVVYGWVNELPVAQAPWWIERLLRPVEVRPACWLSGPKPHRTAEAVEQLGEGQRNTGIFRYVARLVWEGLGESEILSAAGRANRLRCSPPLPDREIEIMVRNSCRRYR